MYSPLLSVHSVFRWLVLICLVFALYRAYTGWKYRKPFSARDNTLRHWTATIAHVQLALGIWLYAISPVIQYFFSNYREAVHQREVRFFGMEHSMMMVVAVVLITIGSMRAKRQPIDNQKFKTIFVWYGIALCIILLNIPWSFSPLVSRPLWRGF